VELEEGAEAFIQPQSSRKVRHFGVSNPNLYQIEPL
jgi:predicted oxidoreductase